MKRFALVVLLVGLVASALYATSCAVVQPYEREVLADPIMQFDSDGLCAAYYAKMLETREGSAGGEGGASGGCGCK